ncbi:Uncharacterised protein [Chlamydia trachomatis]|nr:Uncharacterised protein [Chlamydia trachomatis]CRH46709.1 Uncharacterised protein [Chlamydia trachomatis]CRH55487.1 Uncharacterised protein [Chlamydia trachomatis]
MFKGYERLENSPTLIAYGLGLPLILIPIYFIHKIILLLIEKKNQKQNTIKNFEMILTPRERKQAKK